MCGNEEPQVGREQGCEHTQHDYIRFILVEIDIEDFTPYCTRYRCAEEEGTGELAYTGNKYGLFECNGLGGDGGGEGIGNIIGSYQETIHEAEYATADGDPQVFG